MKPRFLADADLNYAIVSGVKRREPTVDFRSAQSLSLDGLPDVEVLAIASREHRILVSHDFGTMPRHFHDFVTHDESPGLFLISQRLPAGSAVDELLLIWEASDHKDWANQITYLPL